MASVTIMTAQYGHTFNVTHLVDISRQVCGTICAIVKAFSGSY